VYGFSSPICVPLSLTVYTGIAQGMPVAVEGAGEISAAGSHRRQGRPAGVNIRRQDEILVPSRRMYSLNPSSR